VIVEYLGPCGEVHLPQCGVTVARGGRVEVPDEVAGRAPDRQWRRALPGEMSPGGGWTPAGWPLRDGQTFDHEGAPVWYTRDPGEGLLAQEDSWRSVGSVPSGEED
jgi:hypothetical protein